MERSYAKLTAQKITGFLGINALPRAVFSLPLPLVAGVGHSFIGNYLRKELQKNMQLQCTKFSLLDSIMLNHAVSKFQAILLQTIHIAYLMVNCLAFLILKRIGFPFYLHSGQPNMLVDFSFCTPHCQLKLTLSFSPNCPYQ